MIAWLDENGDDSLRALCSSYLIRILDEIEARVEAERKKDEWLDEWDNKKRSVTVLPEDYYLRCDEPGVSSADVNDLRSRMKSRLPRCMWLQWNDDALLERRASWRRPWWKSLVGKEEQEDFAQIKEGRTTAHSTNLNSRH